MKIVFMGTPYYAVQVLESLINHQDHDVILCITQPDKPKDRGQKLQATFVKEYSLINNIPVLQPESLKEESVIDEIAALKPDVIVVVAYGQILPERLLSITKYGCINVHPSLLPKYRGAAPINHAILNGDKISGTTIMYMDKGLDSGDIILQQELAIEDHDTAGTFGDKLINLGANLVIETLDLIKKGEAPRQKQDDSLSTYACMLTKEMGHIDWSKTSYEIFNLIRGLNPSPVAYTFISDEKLRIWQALVFDTNKTGKHGEVIDVIKSKGIVVKTGDGAVILTEIQASSSRRMLASDYLRGHPIEIGTVLK